MASLIPIRELFSNYKNWVRNNPDKVSDFEVAFKWSSYVLAGRLNNSMLPTETVYAASNLLVFFNDRIIKSSVAPSAGPSSKLQVWLTVLEYLEVIIELSAQKIWGAKMKWLILGAVQTLKCALRLMLLLKYKKRLVPSPAIPQLKRNNESTSTGSVEPTSVGSVSFTLKRSGRIIRKVEASPSNGSRIWKPPVADVDVSDDSDEEGERQAFARQMTGETLYIVKPLAHLAASYRYGQTSWKPWLLSLGMDIASLLLLKSKARRRIPREEKLEISRRMLLLLLYVMRSPFYERHSADRVDAFLDALGRTVPLARFLCDPVKLYIPHFRSTYSYVWST